MGEYVKHPTTGVEIKIGCVDNNYNREALLRLYEEGYRGFYLGRYNTSLEDMLSKSNTMYGFKTYAEIRELNGDVEIEPKIDLSEVIFTLPVSKELAHGKVHLHKGPYHYTVECQEKGRDSIKAKFCAMKYIDGQYQTIFECACCGFGLFVIDHFVAMLLRNLHPELKDLIHSYEDIHANSKNAEELPLFDTLEILAETYTYEQFMRLVSNGNVYEIEDMIKSYGYPTLFYFYNQNNKRNKIEAQ